MDTGWHHPIMEAKAVKEDLMKNITLELISNMIVMMSQVKFKKILREEEAMHAKALIQGTIKPGSIRNASYPEDRKTRQQVRRSSAIVGEIKKAGLCVLAPKYSTFVSYTQQRSMGNSACVSKDY